MIEPEMSVVVRLGRPAQLVSLLLSPPSSSLVLLPRLLLFATFGSPYWSLSRLPDLYHSTLASLSTAFPVFCVDFRGSLRICEGSRAFKRYFHL